MSIRILSAAASAAVATFAVSTAQAEVARVLSPDGLREVWAPGGCHCLWGAERASQAAPWSAPQRLFQIRGAIGRIAFSPDGRRIAFENPRGDWTMANAKADPSFVGFHPVRTYGWSFIALYDFDRGRIAYVDPSFATDTDPAWSMDGAAVSFTRHAEGAADARLTRPATPAAHDAIQDAGRSGSIASFFASPLVFQPAASRDGRVIAYAAREGAERAIYLIRDGGPARELVRYGGDDGQELSEIALSPDGDLVAYVRGGSPNKRGGVANPRTTSEPPEQEVFIGSTAPGGAPHKLAAGSRPQFTPDGSRLIWQGERGLMVAPVLRDGPGEPKIGEASVMLAGEVEGARLAPDSRRLAYVRGNRLEVYDLATDRFWRIDGPDELADSSPSWSPDGRWLVYIRTSGRRGPGYQIGWGGPYESKVPWSIRIADVEAGATREVWRARPGVGSSYYPLDEDPTGSGRRDAQLFWTKGDRIVFSWEGDGWRHLYAAPAAGGEATLLTPGDGDVEAAALSLDGSQVIAATNIGDLGRRHLAAIDVASGRFTPVTDGETSQWGPTPLADGGLAYIEAGFSTPPAVRVRGAGGATVQAALPALPAGFPADRFVKPRLIELKAEDGRTAWGQLFVPDRPSGCGVVFAHGGIIRQMLPGFHYMEAYSHLYEMNQYLASRGCVVLSVEYRSSIMRGYAFRNAEGWGSTGASEQKDVLAAGLYLTSHPELKVRHVGVYGLSWGGYVTAQALARHSDVFEAGFDMAGVHEFFGEAMANAPEAFTDGWRSPVLLVQGDDDRNVDFYQGLSLAALLRKKPGLDVRLAVVPDEIHDLTSTFETLTQVYGDGAAFLLEKLAARAKP